MTIPERRWQGLLGAAVVSLFLMGLLGVPAVQRDDAGGGSVAAGDAPAAPGPRSRPYVSPDTTAPTITVPAGGPTTTTEPRLRTRIFSRPGRSSTTTAPVPTTVPAEGGAFSLACPTALTVQPGATGTATCTVASTSRREIRLHVECTFSLASDSACSAPPSLRVPARGRVELDVEVTAGDDPTTDGRAGLEVVVTRDGTTERRDDTVAVTVPDFGVACRQETSTCTVSSSGGFTGEVAVSCSGNPTPKGMTCEPRPPTVTPPADGEVEVELVVTHTAETPPGPHTLTVSVTHQGHTHSTTYEVEVGAAG